VTLFVISELNFRKDKKYFIFGFLLNRKYSPSMNKNKFSDPYTHFRDWLAQAVVSGIPEPNAMVLSTSTRNGRVSSRVVLMKQLKGKDFVFFSNYDSQKAQQILENPWGSLTFFWPALNRQIRVEGIISKTGRNESVKYFNSRPFENRISACISPQSCVIPDREFLLAIKQGFILDLGKKLPVCPDNWGGFNLRPDMLEFWQGGEFRLHDRIRYRLEKNKWVIERLAP
jgi:pyridoxamine 5'-phosphate oxidase